MKTKSPRWEVIRNEVTGGGKPDITRKGRRDSGG